MASQEEIVESLIKDIKFYSKNPIALTKSLNKLDNNKLKKLYTLNKEIKANVECEINKHPEDDKNIKEHKIKDALIELKYKDNKYYFKEDIKNISEVSEKIEKGKINFNDEDIEKNHNILTDGEINMQSIPLYPRFIKSKLYNRFIQKNGTQMQDLQQKFKLERRQIYYYLNFYELINEYNFLLKINLSFSLITKNIKKIKEIINADEELKQVCGRKLQPVQSFRSIEKRLSTVSVDNDDSEKME